MVYCLPLFGGCDNSQIKDLQNRAAQIVTHSAPRSSRADLYDNLGWLTVNQVIVYHSLIAVYKVRQSNEPEYLSGKLSVDTPTGRILIPNTKLRFAQDSFIIRASSNHHHSLFEHSYKFNHKNKLEKLKTSSQSNTPAIVWVCWSPRGGRWRTCSTQVEHRLAISDSIYSVSSHATSWLSLIAMYLSNRGILHLDSCGTSMGLCTESKNCDIGLSFF